MRLGSTMPDRLTDYELGVLLELRERMTLPEIVQRTGFSIPTIRYALESIGALQ